MCADQVSAAVYKVDFDVTLTRILRGGDASAETLKNPIKGSTSLIYNSDGTFLDDGVLRNWTGQFKDTRLMGEASGRHVEQVLNQFKAGPGWKVVYNAQTETTGLDIGFDALNPEETTLGYENFFQAALLAKYAFSAGVTRIGVGGLDVWQGSAQVSGFSTVPVPAALYLFASGFVALCARKRRP